MTIFFNDSRAGHSDTRAATPVVPAAAVWEPSGPREGTAAQRSVRTLQPQDRTLHRATEALNPPVPSTWRERSRRRREAGVAYLLGGLFGLAVVGASMFGIGAESATGEVLTPSYAGTRGAVENAGSVEAR